MPLKAPLPSTTIIHPEEQEPSSSDKDGTEGRKERGGGVEEGRERERERVDL